jgi:hypothetical protein
MASQLIHNLFAQDIYRRIEEVIKVDQVDEQIILDEINEYVLTKAIRDYYRAILERYWETPNRPHEGIAVWVSGFFGSGKSSFAKNLGIALANRSLLGNGAAPLFGAQSGDERIRVLLQQIVERIPTHAVIFDISTDRGIRTGSQTVTEIMYRLFLESLGYARDLDLSELEITLESEGRLHQFKDSFARIYERPWDQQKGLVAIALSQASRVMHELDPATFPTPDSWVQAAKQRADVTPGLLAERCKLLMARHKPGHTLIFVIDEIGQFVARDVQKMLDLQAVVQSLGRVGRGKMWVVVTSQEKLNELVGGLDDKRVELARLMDRFPHELQVHLEPSDISEVTGKRVLAKNADAQDVLRPLFEAHRGALDAHTRLTADIKLPELSADRFIDLYPLLPYQVDLIIQIVSGLRMQGGMSKHVGGANRTIIKLAQQLLINPIANLAEQSVGSLVRIDHIYDLVDSNIASDIRGKIAAIPHQVNHPLAQSVAKAICLLQYVKSVHRTAENIAAALYPAVGADSQLPAVRAALDELVKAHLVRQGDDGYRIPTPTEDDWERQRASLSPSVSDTNRIYVELTTRMWTPQPAWNFMQTKQFRAGLMLQGQPRVEGDINVYLYLTQPGRDYDQITTELRSRSQVERTTIFWVAQLNDALDRELVELYRSQEILSRKERGAQTKEEARLVSEEVRRRDRHAAELQRLLRQTVLRGTVFFRGNDRSPDERASDIERTVGALLGIVLPEVFDRFEEAAARVQQKDLDTLLTADNLHGLTPVFAKLRLLQDKGGKPTFNAEHGPLAEVLARISNRANFGEGANGRYLADEFAKDPFGWEFDMVKLLTAALLRAGKIEMTSKGQVIESATSLESRATFGNNNLFRQASFRPKVGLDFDRLIQAAQAYQETFGREVPGLEQNVVADTIRSEMTSREPDVQEIHTLLVREGLPGVGVLSEALNQMRAIRTGKEESTILGFTSSAKPIKEAIRRAAELRDTLTEPALHDLRQARVTLTMMWPFLRDEPDLDLTLATAATQLDDILRRETFYRELAVVSQLTQRVRQEYARHERVALERRIAVYSAALEQLAATPGWDQLESDQQERIAGALRRYTVDGSSGSPPIPQVLADIDACPSRLAAAVEQLLHLIEGNRLVKVSLTRFFQGGIESEEELDAALEGLRAEIARLIGEGKKVLVQ